MLFICPLSSGSKDVLSTWGVENTKVQKYIQLIACWPSFQITRYMVAELLASASELELGSGEERVPAAT